MKKLPSWLRWVCGGIVGLIVIGLISLVVVYWEWFATEPCGMESRSTTARNVGILFFGLIAIGFGIWRGVVASRQAKTSHRGLLNERYQKGGEMLGSNVLAVRLGGIYALKRLAEEEPEQYHVQIMGLFCAFVRNPTKDEEAGTRRVRVEQSIPGLSQDLQAIMPPITTPRDADGSLLIKVAREDVQAIMTAIGSRSNAVRELEKKEPFLLDLSRADLADAVLNGANLTRLHLYRVNLSGADLTDANLSNVSLFQAKLTGAYLNSANLSNANLVVANLTDADLSRAILVDTNLTRANLTHADFFKATGLTQQQLDRAVADPANPPKLDEAYDAKTNRPLEWRGREPY